MKTLFFKGFRAVGGGIGIGEFWLPGLATFSAGGGSGDEFQQLQSATLRRTGFGQLVVFRIARFQTEAATA